MHRSVCLRISACSVSSRHCSFQHIKQIQLREISKQKKKDSYVCSIVLLYRIQIPQIEVPVRPNMQKHAYVRRVWMLATPSNPCCDRYGCVSRIADSSTNVHIRPNGRIANMIVIALR